MTADAVRVFFYATVRERTGTFETRVENFSGTLAELLKRLEEIEEIHESEIFSGASGELCGQKKEGEAGRPDPLSLLIIMINGRHIAHVGGLDAPVSGGDVVSIFPLVGGG